MNLNIQQKEKIISSLTVFLADLYTLYYKFQVFHWHVKGPHFKALHEQFEENYTALAQTIDEVAERIVTLGGKAPTSFKQLIEMSTIKQEDLTDSEDMVKALVADNVTVIESARTLAALAGDAGDEGTGDLLAPLISAREKATWMLESFLG